MRPAGCEAEVIRALASMPFLDRTEMVAVTGRSKGAVYEAVERLEQGGFCTAVPHAAPFFPQTQRYHLAAAGLHWLAGEEGKSLDDLMLERPVSAQWRRNLMERLDALASIYRLAAGLAALEYPIRFRWYRALPLDAAVELPGGRSVGIVRRGNTADRSPFSNRMWRLRGRPLPGAVLVLMPDPVRLRHSRRMLDGFPAPVFLAVEGEAVAATPDDPVWTPAPVSADVDLRSLLASLEEGGEIPEEGASQRVSVPADFSVEGPGWDIPDYMLPSTIKAAEKRAVELVSDWPWLTLTDLAGLMGVSHQRASQIVIPLEFFKLVARPSDTAGRLVITDRGLALSGPKGPHLPGHGEGPLERSAPHPRRPLRLDHRHRQEEPPAAQEHRAHRRRPRLHRAPVRAGRPRGLGGLPARPAPTGVQTLQARKREALRQPRRIRRPAEGRDDLALLPGVGAQGRAAHDHVGAAGPISALLLISQAHRRPRHAARRPGRLRRRHRPHPLPARGAGGDAGPGRLTCPCGSPTGRP